MDLSDFPYSLPIGYDCLLKFVFATWQSYLPVRVLLVLNRNDSWDLRFMVCIFFSGNVIAVSYLQNRLCQNITWIYSKYRGAPVKFAIVSGKKFSTNQSRGQYSPCLSPFLLHSFPPLVTVASRTKCLGREEIRKVLSPLQPLSFSFNQSFSHTIILSFSLRDKHSYFLTLNPCVIRGLYNVGNSCNLWKAFTTPPALNPLHLRIKEHKALDQNGD